jgi:hypothetical protein
MKRTRLNMGRPKKPNSNILHQTFTTNNLLKIRLELFADSKECTVSDVVRKAIVEYLDKYSPEPVTPVLEEETPSVSN